MNGSDGWRRFAALTALVTYLLIILGGFVRITGSGMGCGDDWPLCNGHLLPPWDFATWVEWGHRLVAGLVSFLVAGLLVWAFLRRREGVRGGRRLRVALLGTGLLIVQILLGAVTVWLELPPTTIVLHLGTAMSLLALLLLSWLGWADAPLGPSRRDPAARMAFWLAALSAITVMLGGLVANLDAAPACQGFPLCNGSILPGGHWRIHLHWTHRLAAYALVLGVVALPAVGKDRARTSAWSAAALAAAQLVVGAVMVLQILPQGWRIAHVAFGTAVFGSLVAHAYLLRRGAASGLIAGRRPADRGAASG